MRLTVGIKLSTLSGRIDTERMPAPKRQEESDVASAAQRIVRSDATKSDKIRRLAGLGLPRADVARALGVRYQFVRNVLEHDAGRAAPRARPALAERRRIDALTAHLDTKAARIRALAAAGFSRSRIAAALGLRYQHVYNVLTPSAAAGDRVAEQPSTPSAWLPPPMAAAGPDPVRVVVEPGRRLAIPEVFAAALGISDGDEVMLRLAGDELRLYGQEAAIRRVQRLVARHVPAEVSLVDELLAERRHEAGREVDE